MTEEQYLHTSFDNPDPEFRDGKLLARNSCDLAYSETCVQLISLFARHSLGERCRPSLRLKLRKGFYRVPDLCLFYPEEPSELIPSAPPLLVIEILSPGHRLPDLAAKLEEYRRWGVTHAWIVDPSSGRVYSCDSEFAEVPALTIPTLNLELRPTDIFESTC